MSTPFAVSFLDSQAEIPASLWDACFPLPLEGRWWYEVLEQSGLEDQFTFRYALLRLAGRDVGIAPLFLMDVPLDIVTPDFLLPLTTLLGRIAPSLMRQRTLFVGSPCSDEGAVGLMSGIDRRGALMCLQQALDKEARRLRAPMLVWKDFPSHYLEDLGWVAAKAGLFAMTSYPGTVAVLPSRNREDFFAAMKGSRRQKLKRKLRISAKRVDLDTAVVSHPDAFVLDEIFGLFRQTYERSATKFERLNPKFFEVMAALPHAYFLILREASSGDMVAFMLCLEMSGLIINKFIGLDYARPKEWSLFFRLWEAALDWSLARGASAIQSGQTGYAPKMEMGHVLVPLKNYCRHQNPVMQFLYAALSRTVSWETLDPALAHYANADTERDTSVASSK
jgi:hypothetical protein